MINELCNYVNLLFKNITNYQDVIIGIEKLEEYLLKNNIKLDTSLVVRLFNESDCLLQSFDILYFTFESDIKAKKLDKISFCYTGLFLLRIYCILNDIINDIENIDENHLLSHEEEIILIKRIKKGDKFAQEIFFKCNMALIKNVARKFNTSKMTYEDLVQEGCLGLLRAIELYDENLGNKFSSYAIHWIYQAISRAIHNKERMIKLPEYVLEKIKKIVNVSDYLSDKLHREPTNMELAKEMNIDVLEVEELKKHLNDTFSLDATIGDDTDLTFGDLVRDEGYDLEEKIIDSILHNELESFINKCNLNETELMILQLKYGLNGYDVHSTVDVAKILKLNREMVRQKEIRILNKIRNKNGIESFIVYLDNPSQALDTLSFFKKDCGYVKNSTKKVLEKKNIQ